MRALLPIVLSLLPLSSAFAASPTIPDTPAGHVLQAWLDAFNSGDRARIEAYHKKYEPQTPADQTLGFRKMTGGFNLLGVDKSEPRHIEFRVQEKASPTMAVGKIDVKEGDPAQVANFSMRAIPPGMTAADMNIKVDAATRTRVIDAIATKLTEYYVYADGAKKMVAAMRAHQKKGEYDAITDGDTFAEALTRDLKAVSHDGHLRVVCVPKALPKEDPPDDDDTVDPEDRARMERANCGFEKAERLEGNIGYIKFDFFGNPGVCGPTATAAINFLANVDALIFDLRENHGGDPAMVSYVVSYLFDKRTHINDLYERKRNKTVEYWTNPGVPGKKIVGKPVYVLTSKGTFSGGEEFTYDLKTQKRATIIGETTGGGAHPAGPRRVDDHFFVVMPGGRPIDPITKKDWEGTGVEPDVKVAAAEALDVAKKMAMDQIKKKPAGNKP